MKNNQKTLLFLRKENIHFAVAFDAHTLRHTGTFLIRRFLYILHLACRLAFYTIALHDRYYILLRYFHTSLSLDELSDVDIYSLDHHMVFLRPHLIHLVLQVYHEQSEVGDCHHTMVAH